MRSWSPTKWILMCWARTTTKGPWQVGIWVCICSQVHACHLCRSLFWKSITPKYESSERPSILLMLEPPVFFDFALVSPILICCPPHINNITLDIAYVLDSFCALSGKIRIVTECKCSCVLGQLHTVTLWCVVKGSEVGKEQSNRSPWLSVSKFWLHETGFRICVH